MFIIFYHFALHISTISYCVARKKFVAGAINCVSCCDSFGVDIVLCALEVALAHHGLDCCIWQISVTEGERWLVGYLLFLISKNRCPYLFNLIISRTTFCLPKNHFNEDLSNIWVKLSA